MLPSGGGKSTLALHALRDNGCRLLTEDSHDRNWAALRPLLGF
jgi:hypothetical protein